MRTLLTLLFFLPITSVSALDCSKAISTLDISRCSKIEQEKVESELNKVYKRVMKNLEAKTKQSLRKAQRIWVKFRKADCDAVYAHNAPGSMSGLMYSGCMKSRAEHRIKELNGYLEPN